MIIKVSHDLRVAILGIGQPPQEEYPLVPIPGSPYKPTEDLSHLKPLVPEWLEQAAGEGSVIVIDRQDYDELPPELYDHVQVLKA